MWSVKRLCSRSSARATRLLATKRRPMRNHAVGVMREVQSIRRVASSQSRLAEGLPMKTGMKTKPRPINLDAPLSREADQFLADATDEFNAKQKALNRDWLRSFKQWGFEQQSGTFRLEFADGSEAHFDGQILGSYSPTA